MPTPAQIENIKDAIDNQHDLTEDEADFVNAIAERDNNARLSRHEAEKLSRISAKVQRREVH